MKQKLVRLLSGILVGAMLLSGCGETKETHAREKLPVKLVVKEDLDWNTLQETEFVSKEKSEAFAEYNLEKVGEVLEMPYWWEEVDPEATCIELKVKFKHEGNSTTYNTVSNKGNHVLAGGFELNPYSSSLERYDGGMSHEMTHMLGFLNNFSYSLDEGMCEYVYNRVSPITLEGFPYASKRDYAEHSMQLAYKDNGYQEHYDNLISQIGTEEQHYPFVEELDLSIWYGLSHSFVEYLVEQYGLHTVEQMILQGSGEDAYQEYLGTSLEELRANWFDEVMHKDFHEIEEQMAEKGIDR